MRSYHKANRFICFYNNINFTRSLSNCIVTNISASCTKQCINVIFSERKSDTSCSLYAIGNDVEHQPYQYLLYSLDLLITCGVRVLLQILNSSPGCGGGSQEAWGQTGNTECLWYFFRKNIKFPEF